MYAELKWAYFSFGLECGEIMQIFLLKFVCKMDVFENILKIEHCMMINLNISNRNQLFFLK